jgi:hypothetical protein
MQRLFKRMGCRSDYPKVSLFLNLNLFFRMLPCGHSFCEDCLYLLFKAQDKSIACPTCLVAHNVESKKQIETTFMKNFGLIALAE